MAQFGFIPGRNTLQPIFILRHLVEAGRRRQSANRQVYAAFIDFSQAYDTVDRTKLWRHLSDMQVPVTLLQTMQSMYAGDSYVLVDGHKQTEHIEPLRGVKQGCPLSPLLFALYVSDVVDAFPTEWGAMTGCNDVRGRVSHLMYADDLTLVANSANNLQRLLDKLAVYAEKKGLTINVRKSQVMVFNPGRNQGSVEFTLGGRSVERVREFKFLGVVFNEKAGMDRAAEYAAGPLMAGIRRVRDMAHNFCVSEYPHVLLWLFQSFALSAGLYGSQVWSTHLLEKLMRGQAVESDVHLRHLGFVKHVLQVKRSTSSLVVLREAGQLPMHFYWLRSVVRFWNACVEACEDQRLGCPLLREVIMADLQLSTRKGCWIREVEDALGQLDIVPKVKLSSVAPGGAGEPHLIAVDEKGIEAALFRHLKQPWAACDSLHPRSVDLPQSSGRKLVVYEKWMASPWDKDLRPPLPQYLRLDVPSEVLRNVARFRTSSHRLRVETGRWSHLAWSDRKCEDCEVVQDERHVLLECPAFADLRNKYQELLRTCGDQMLTLMNSECSKQLARFVHDCMKRVDLFDHVSRDYIDLTGDGEQPTSG